MHIDNQNPITKIEWNIANEIGSILQDAEKKQKELDEEQQKQRDSS